MFEIELDEIELDEIDLDEIELDVEVYRGVVFVSIEKRDVVIGSCGRRESSKP